MGHWLDAVAKASAARRGAHRTSPPSAGQRPPGPGRPNSSASAAAQQGLTRRDLLRKGAVVGVAAWSVPVLQSAVAPAAAASDPCAGVCGDGTTCPQCGPGAGVCTANNQCSTGVCQANVCVQPYSSNAPCTASNQCQSGLCLTNGTCAAAWPGTTCTTNNQCQSGKCVGGRCFENGLNSPCQSTLDCTDNTTCGGTPKVCGGSGALCANNQKCVTGRCRNGVCD